jgi:hypothetical protein
MIDPDLAAVLLTFGVAGLLALGALPAAVRRRRALERACARCGRRVVLGERTCDCRD